MSTNAVRAVIFDMDGLMLDTERLECAACEHTAAAMGLSLDQELYLRLVGRNSKDAKLIFMECYGQDFPYEEFHFRWRQRRDELVAAKGVQIKPGLLELLEHLQGRGVGLGVATSTGRVRARRLLTSTSLLERFHTIVCGDEVSKGKPAPDIFLKAASSLGVPVAQCIVLEDSEPGVMAAHAAGMRAIVVPDLKPPAPEIAKLALAICASLHQVRGLL